MSRVGVNPNTMTIEISGELMERFGDACAFASTHPSLAVMHLVEQFTEGEETKMEAKEGTLDYRKFSQRRSRELWDEMKHRIDYDSAPNGGPDSIYHQELRLEEEIERIIEDEWQKIEES
jgi:hypothetical protein